MADFHRRVSASPHLSDGWGTPNFHLSRHFGILPPFGARNVWRQSKWTAIATEIQRTPIEWPVTALIVMCPPSEARSGRVPN